MLAAHRKRKRSWTLTFQTATLARKQGQEQGQEKATETEGNEKGKRWTVPGKKCQWTNWEGLKTVREVHELIGVVRARDERVGGRV